MCFGKEFYAGGSLKILHRVISVPVKTSSPPRPSSPGRQAAPYVPAGVASTISRITACAADYVMTGKVLSEEGEALQGATVSLHQTGLSRITFEWPAALLTQMCDNQGRYTIQLDSPLHAFVVIRAEGYAQKEEEIDFLEPGMLAKDYRLRIAPACVSGYVRTKDGKPVPGAVVVASSGSLSTTLDRSWFSLVTATADKSGRYEIRGIPEGFTVVAAVSATHHAAQEEIDDLKKGNCKRISFRLDAGIRIAFVVKNRRGEVIPQGGTVGNGLGEVVFTVPAEKGPFEYTVKARGYRDKTIILDPTVPARGGCARRRTGAQRTGRHSNGCPFGGCEGGCRQLGSGINRPDGQVLAECVIRIRHRDHGHKTRFHPATALLRPEPALRCLMKKSSWRRAKGESMGASLTMTACR